MSATPSAWSEVERDQRGPIMLIVFRCRWCSRQAVYSVHHYKGNVGDLPSPGPCVCNK